MNIKDIPGYEGVYGASDCGSVFRLKTREGKPILRKVANRNKKGYAVAHLSFEARRRDLPVHRCVWLAHRGEIPTGIEVNHINGVRDDNRLENLELVTKSGNALHKFRTLGYRSRGRGVSGSGNHNAKLSEQDIKTIRSMSANHTNTAIAAVFNVSAVAVGLIVRRKTWRHVD